MWPAGRLAGAVGGSPSLAADLFQVRVRPIRDAAASGRRRRRRGGGGVGGRHRSPPARRPAAALLEDAADDPLSLSLSQAAALRG